MFEAQTAQRRERAAAEEQSRRERAEQENELRLSKHFNNLKRFL
jgi:hypothetical protein